MRARFTDSIASADYSYSAGTTVSVEGERWGFDTVPEKMGRVWLKRGLLVAVKSEPESASTRSTETAALAAAAPRHPRG